MRVQIQFFTPKLSDLLPLSPLKVKFPQICLGHCICSIAYLGAKLFFWGPSDSLYSIDMLLPLFYTLFIKFVFEVFLSGNTYTQSTRCSWSVYRCIVKLLLYFPKTFILRCMYYNTIWAFYNLFLCIYPVFIWELCIYAHIFWSPKHICSPI